MHTEFWWGNLRKIAPLEVLDVDGRLVLKWVLKKEDGGGGLD
jgi:hypothetical protein